GRLARELPMIPKVLEQPHAAERPQSPLRAIDRRGGAPDIRVVVHDPTAGPIHLTGNDGTGLSELACHSEERLDALAECSDIREPIIHLGVDVDRPLAFPGRTRPFVPDALQVRRLRARA